MIKRLSLLIVLFFCLVTLWAKPFVVVIDAGHGGRDPGAVGKGIQEKTINLDISLRLGKLIRANLQDVKVVYTRDKDYFVELQDRADIANKYKADLFISVHTNALGPKGRHIYGTETYTLGLARTEENLEVAKRENAVILLEDDYSERYEGFDPKSSESYIIFELMQNNYMDQSVAFAADVQREFKTTAQRLDKGVKQAGFLVLRNTTMPSVLVEVGYLSNSSEEQYLKTENGRAMLARSIYNAFRKYKKSWDQKQTGTTSQTSGQSATVQAGDMEVVGRSSGSTARQTRTPAASNTKSTSTKKGTTVYKLQLLSHKQKLPLTSKLFKGLQPIEVYRENGLYKYTYKSTTSYQEIVREQKKIESKFKNAPILKFRNGVRIK